MFFVVDFVTCVFLCRAGLRKVLGASAIMFTGGSFRPGRMVKRSSVCLNGCPGSLLRRGIVMSPGGVMNRETAKFVSMGSVFARGGMSDPLLETGSKRGFFTVPGD